MNRCPNCGYERSMMTGREIMKKFRITIVNTPIDDLMSLTCLCGHHAKDHKGEGTAGTCVKCFGAVGNVVGGFVHNFIPTRHTKQLRFPLEEVSK